MDRLKPLNLAPFVLLFFVGIGNLFHFSQHVRRVDAVGLSGGGFSLGLAAFAFLTAIRARIKP